VKPALGVFLLTLLAYLTTAGGHLYSPDEELMFRMTESLAVDRDLAIEPLELGFASRRGVDGKEYSQYGVGQPLLAVPFYVLGRALAPLADDDAWARAYGLTKADEPGWWGTRATAADLAPRLAVSFFNILAGAVLAGFLCLLLQEITGHRGAATLASLLYALGSYAWAHSRPYYSESLAVLFIVLSWYALLRSCRGNVTRWNALAGAAAGYAALVRMDSVILYPATALLLLGPVMRAALDQRPRLHPYIAFCLPAMLCGGVILGLNTLHFGGPFEMGYADQSEGIKFHTPLLVGLHGFLFSAGRGLFFFSPALVLGLLGWKDLFGRSRWLGAATALAILIPLCFMAKWQNWAGGWTWGPRHIFMLHPFLAVPAAVWLAAGWNRVRRAVAMTLIFLGAGVQIFGSSQDFILYYQLYFRNTNGRYFRELYDFFDQAYWGRYYRLHYRTEPGAESVEVPLTFVPAPIHHSIYIPQYTAWSAYPQMLRDYGTLDNLWWRLFVRPAAPIPDAEPEPGD
jgi:hypothetical protein